MSIKVGANKIITEKSKLKESQALVLDGKFPVMDKTQQSIDDSALSDLHSKIQGQIQSSKNRAKKAKTGGSKASSKTIQDKIDPIESKSESVTKGKKRDSSGNVLEKKRQTSKKIEHDDYTEGSHQAPEEELLEVEVRELGGTVEDLDLLAGVQSDSELEGENAKVGMDSSGPQVALQRGLQNIMKEIKLAQGQRQAADEEVAADDEQAGDQINDSALQGRDEAPADVPDTTSSRSTRARIAGLAFQPRPDWYNAFPVSKEPVQEQKYTLSKQTLEELHTFARSLLDAENEAFRKTQQSSSSQSFYNTVIASGTLSDKVSALTLAVQESPVHNVKALETLVGLAKKRSRAQAVDVLRALKDLFAQGSLLPGDRRLFTFASQPQLIAAFGKTRSWKAGDDLPPKANKTHLIIWSFEGWLKVQYFEILQTLEVWCNDEIEFSKSRAVSFVFELLKEKPEQESNLLRLLVNKLGDPVKKIASQTSYLVMQLLAAHPAMKEIVVAAVEADFLFRPGQNLHAKYYAVVTLNQTALSSQEEAVAVRLLSIYFSLFVALLKSTDDKMQAQTNGVRSKSRQTCQEKAFIKKSKTGYEEKPETELRERFISAILTGINRAYPYTSSEEGALSTHLDTLFKITHSSNFNTSIQAMMLIQQLSPSLHASADRFFRTLYESLLDPRLIHSSKQQLYLNLLHRSLKSSLDIKQVKAFAKRILQVLHLHEPSFVCGAFFLLSDLEKTFPGLKGLVDQPEEHDDEDEVFQDVVDSTDQAGMVSRSAPEGVHPARTKYDGKKRDPEHSHAENSCAWELLPFLAHYHPSVAVSADYQLRHAGLPGKPDLNLHTLIHFLDRFVHRNPKQAASNLRGASIMQPMAASGIQGVLINSTTHVKQGMPLNSDDFRIQKNGQVAAEDAFFHQYFTNIGKDSSKKKSKRKATDAEDDVIGNDKEDEVWKAMMDSAPDLEGAEDEEDLEFSDLESDFEYDLDGMDDDELEEDGERENEAEEIAFESFEDEVEEDLAATTGIVPAKAKTDGSSHNALAREKRRRMKQLPMFATAEDYEKMMASDDNEDLG